MEANLSSTTYSTPDPMALIGIRTERKIRVLVVDDEPTNVMLITRFLTNEGYDVVRAGDGREALEKVHASAPDLILLDVTMPVMDGIAVCDALRSEFYTRSIPIILVTARNTLEERIKGLHAGIDDFLSKPFDLDELKARLEGALLRRRWDQSSQPLTHLPASPMIEEEVWKRLRVGSPFAFAYIDIDNFKAYNDVYGFDAGDRVIKTLASSLMEAVKLSKEEKSFAGHIGGDDFVFLSAIPHLKAVMPQLTTEFDSQRLNFYHQEDLDRGGIQTKNRLNEMQNFPLMTLSVAVISIQSHRILHYGRLVEMVSELKRHVKMQDHSGRSLTLWDRRCNIEKTR